MLTLTTTNYSPLNRMIKAEFNLNTLDDMNVTSKRVIIREDLNVPIAHGVIQDDTRIKAALPTIQHLLNQNAAVIVLSHLGRPKGQQDPQFSLAPVAHRLSDLLKRPIPLIQNWLEGIHIKPGEIVMCENIRFQAGETTNDPTLSQQIARLGDVFVMDAFATAHRAHASTVGVTHYLNDSCAGPLLSAELRALLSALETPKRPLLAVVGGAKVSTKLKVLRRLSEMADQIIVGGGIANTFIAALNHPVGKSLFEPDLITTAQQILRMQEQGGAQLPLPHDVIVAPNIEPNTKGRIKALDDVANTDMILDIGPETIAHYQQLIKQAGTIIWNGPVGLFEHEAFAKGTEALTEAIANSQAYSVAGGGDTLAAIARFDAAHGISYQSTGGGAFLALLAGQELPGIVPLRRKSP